VIVHILDVFGVVEDIMKENKKDNIEMEVESDLTAKLAGKACVPFSFSLGFICCGRLW